MPPLVPGAAAVAALNSGERNDSSTLPKCSFRSCPIKSGSAPLFDCGGCNRKAHMPCYQKLLLEKHQLGALSGGVVACTKRCYDKAFKTSTANNVDEDDYRKGNWDSDGKLGPEDPHTSLKILLDWWMEVPNYSKYRGKNNDGVKKKEFCDLLAQKMSNETSSKRDGRNAKSKIEHIERCFKKAHIFATSETGAGLMEDDPSSFEDKVRKKCPQYYDILEVMQDRASTKPKATNYENNSEADDLELYELQGNNPDTLSDVSAGEEEDLGSMQASVQASVQPASVLEGSVSSKGTKRPASVTKSATKKPRPRKVPVLEDDLSTAMNSAARVASDRFSEMQRHNKALEEIERGRYDLERKRDERESRRLDLEQTRLDSQQWKAKSDQLDYQIKLVNKYHEIKSKYGWTDEQILRHFPAMKSVIDNNIEL